MIRSDMLVWSPHSVAVILCVLSNPPAKAEESDEQYAGLLEMSLEDLMNLRVKAASGVEEPLRHAPAAMVVVTAKDIEQRGYNNMDEVLADLPGFDLVKTNGATYLETYQRGNRTSFVQRTLFMVNGVVDNNLWIHTAEFSRQYPLSNVDRIEVLYGPASAIYGPNAFSGVINIITRDANELKDGESEFRAQVDMGSFNSRNYELSARVHAGALKLSLSGRYFKSDEPGLKDFGKSWGFASNEMLSDTRVWGPLLARTNLGRYEDPTEDWGVIGKVGYENFEFGFMSWQVSEGYGMAYASDAVQPNVGWNRSSRHSYIRHGWQAREEISIDTEFVYRTDKTWGQFAEATPDWRPGMSDYSYVSFSDWNSDNESWLFTQNYKYRVNNNLHLSGGVKYEVKDLTKSYEACGYWEPQALCTTVPEPDAPFDPEGFGPWVVHSSAASIPQPPRVAPDMPGSNKKTTSDKGVYIQGIYEAGNLLVHAGVRYDHNSLYGDTVNPRLAFGYDFSERTTVKLLYGTAFHEPAFGKVFGGWNGRQVNLDLGPEKVSNIELIAIHQGTNWIHDASLFFANYSDVIKEQSTNSADRNVTGFEYRGRVSFDNPWYEGSDITGYVNYTFTRAMSDETYNHQISAWELKSSELGDIAPHKFNLGVNFPLHEQWSLNLRTSYVGEQELYSRNPLRDQGEKLDAFVVVNSHLRFIYRSATLGFSVHNLFDVGYYHSGSGAAHSGNDFSGRSQGFQNSLIPQEGRSVRFSVGLSLS